jgi:putative ABC transport system permease protein/lipoprotein-releasing system permease protein
MTELRNERSALSPLLFFRRNRAKTIPLVSTIVLAVVLIISIVSMMNSIPESVRTIYRYSKEYAGVSPRGLAEQVAPIRAAIQEEAPVKIGRIITCRVSDMVVHSIVGKWPFAILALSQEDIPFYLDRMHSRGIVGRTVQPGKPEILLSESIARNLNLKIKWS